MVNVIGLKNASLKQSCSLLYWIQQNWLRYSELGTSFLIQALPGHTMYKYKNMIRSVSFYTFSFKFIPYIYINKKNDVTYLYHFKRDFPSWKNKFCHTFLLSNTWETKMKNPWKIQLNTFWWNKHAWEERRQPL